MASLRRLVSLPNRLTSLSSIARRSAVALPCGHDMGACTCHIRPSSAGNTRYMTTAAVPIVSSATAVVTPVTAPRVGVSAARQQRIAEEQKVLKQACGEAVGKSPSSYPHQLMT